MGGLSNRHEVAENALPLLPGRQPDSHKGTYGSVLIAAGSPFMPGAAVLAARAAYRTGVGLVTVLTDPEVIPMVAAGATESVFTDWAEIGARLALGQPLGADAILVGPGLGTTGRGRLVFDLLRSAEAPVVVDADALNLLAAAPDVTLPDDPGLIWTPHPGEFRRLSGETPKTDAERLAAAARFVDKRGGVLVLKGHRTVIVDREQYAINGSGNPGMATAGSGDVLAGALVALLGQGLSSFDAARLAVHFHGVSGDLAAARLGEISLTASDLIDSLPKAILAHQRA